jgi:hypothetical protein
MLIRSRSVTHDMSCDRIYENLLWRSETRNRRSDATSVNVTGKPPRHFSSSSFLLYVSFGISSSEAPVYYRCSPRTSKSFPKVKTTRLVLIMSSGSVTPHFHTIRRPLTSCIVSLIRFPVRLEKPWHPFIGPAVSQCERREQLTGWFA